jgi:hypothetical protein
VSVDVGVGVVFDGDGDGDVHRFVEVAHVAVADNARVHAHAHAHDNVRGCPGWTAVTAAAGPVRSKVTSALPFNCQDNAAKQPAGTFAT